MLLGGVQIPADVLTAQEEGNLVVFTGAGISVASPSDLPSFAGLAMRVAGMLQSPLDPYSEEWKSQLDTLMGVLNEGEDVDVHRLVQRIVTEPRSLPNANHEALARICANGTVRVVTTNYDLHLENALRTHRGNDLHVYSAPALPLGDDFEGLVYLHGSAEGDARRLVVTDRDFGLAYFHSAWAARFLERMFREHVVLFVGYSHSDVVMKYLGLGLGATSKRYVLTDQPNDPLWRRLHVTALAYPHEQYDVLTACLTSWADIGNMGLLEHRQRIRGLVSSPSQPTPDELSYLEDSLQRPELVRFFCEFAKHKFWLEWAATQEPFQALFDRSVARNEVATQLAAWFAHDFALTDDTDVDDDERPSAKAWEVFAEAGGVLGTDAWSALAMGIHAYGSARPEHVLRWIWVLIEQEHTGCWSDLLDFAFSWDELWADRTLSLGLLEHLIEPRLKPQRSWGSSHMDVTIRGELNSLDRVWQQRFAPELDELAADVFPVAERSLLRHLELEAAASRSSFGFSRRRSAIQPHTQDRYRNPIDPVIDAVRDCAETLSRSNPDFARPVIDRWLASPHVLLQRLAIHTVATSSQLDANVKIRFVLDRGLPDVDGAEQEVLHLLGAITKDADPALVDRVVAAYKPAGSEDRDLYTSFSALEWLERCGVENGELAATLSELRAQLGDVKGSRYPGIRGWTEVGSGEGGMPPLSVDEFDARVRADPGAAVEFVLSFEERNYPRDGGPSRDDAVSMLRGTVEKRAAAGLELWPHLDGQLDIQAAVVSAWGHAATVEDLTGIVEIMVETDLRALGHALTQLLGAAERSDSGPWEKVPATEKFVQRMWEAFATDELYESDPERDWASETINHPAGLLWDFWFEMFRRRWAAAGDDWRGLPDADRAFLDQALDDRTRRGAYAVTQMAARLHFLDDADSTWCRSRLLPMRDWADEGVAEPFWCGLLSWARWNRGLVADGLLDGLMQTVAYLERFGDDEQHRWAAFLASIAVGCETPPTSSWVDELTAKAAPPRRVQWLAAVVQTMEELDETGRAAVWTGWLADYWRRRNQSWPVMLVRDEANELAAAAPLVPASEFAAAVDLVLETAAGLDAHGSGLRYVTDELIDAQPAEVGRYLTLLMVNTVGEYWGSYELAPKLQRLSAKPGGDWTQLREAALRLNIRLE